MNRTISQILSDFVMNTNVSIRFTFVKIQTKRRNKICKMFDVLLFFSLSKYLTQTSIYHCQTVTKRKKKSFRIAIDIFYSKC